MRKSKCIINNDFRILNSLGRSKRQGANFDVTGVMNELVGWENQELSFSKINLEVVVLYPCRYVQETVWDLV